jgi:hypothetical protein
VRADAGEVDAVAGHPGERALRDGLAGDGAGRHLGVGVERPALAGACRRTRSRPFDGATDLAVAQQLADELALRGRGLLSAPRTARSAARRPARP